MRVIGTAGHVDHGKSTLVQALTGINPDRLREEQERQMTIDLGFAWLTLEDGEEVGIVDVPGHRDFIENMLAGVGAIDAVLFVIAADEGIMPQTLEHLAILDLLQVPRGIIALTKIDLVEDEWIELVKEEAQSLFKSTQLEGAPIVPVSAISEIGLKELKDVLTQVLSGVPDPIDVGRPRLPIDRVFTLTGFGTVVTGTLIGGGFKEGQEVEVQPRGIKARIRNLQAHKHKRKQVYPGGRVAINLSGVEKSDIERGDVVVLPGQWKFTKMIDANFHLLDGLDKPLKHNQEVKIFHGTAQRMAKVRLLGKPQLKPGEDGWIQLLLSDAILADRGDHYILRRPSPGATLGGGQVVDPDPKRRYRLKDQSPIERLEKLSAGDPIDVFFEIVRNHGPIQFHEVLHKADLDQERGTSIIKELQARGELIRFGKDDEPDKSFLVTNTAWNTARKKSDGLLDSFHHQHPLRPGMPVEEYRKRMELDPKWSNLFLQLAESDGWLVQEKNCVRHTAHRPVLTEKQGRVVSDLLRKIESQPFNTPSRREILEAIDEEVLQYLIWEDKLVALNEDVFLARDTYSRAVEEIRETMVKQNTLTIAEVRDLFKTSRKYALALMEHLDAIGITVRVEDVRRLKL